MTHLTKNEKTVLLVLAAVIVFGSAVQNVFHRFPAVEEAVSSPQRFVALTNVNTASFDELVRVPYIGQITARAIIEHRRAKGKFRSLDELRSVTGVLPKNYLKMRPYLTL